MGDGWSLKKQYRHWSLVATNRGVESAHGLQGHRIGHATWGPIGPPQNQPTLEGFTTYGDGDPTLSNNVICAVVWSALIVFRVPKPSENGGKIHL